MRRARGSRLVRRAVQALPVPLRRTLVDVANRVRNSDERSPDFAGTVRSLGGSARLVGRTARGFRSEVVRIPRWHERRAPVDVTLVGSAEPTRAPTGTVVMVGARPWPIPDRVVPFGFDAPTRRSFAVFGGVTGQREASPRAAIGGWPIRQLDVVGPSDLQANPDRFRRSLQQHLGVIDAECTWPSDRERAFLLACSAAVGTPVVVEEPDSLRGLLPGPVVDAFTSVDVRTLVEAPSRTAVAFRQWSAVHDAMSMRRAWAELLGQAGRPVRPDRSITVVVATQRPEMIDNWAPQLAAQTYPDVQVVAALHGEAFSSVHERAITDWLGDRVQIVRQRSDAVLGEVLDAASRRAEGELIVKWDDDDLYSTGHLRDLARTFEYSGATLVAKACEYVFLDGPDITVQRVQGPREAFSTTVAGGTLCLARSTLEAVGGWSPAPRRVDSLLVEAVMRSGGSTYRGIGYGYLMMRRSGARGHTWLVGDEHFLLPGNPQRRGLDVTTAMIDAPEEVIARWRR